MCLGGEIEVGVYDKHPTDLFVYAEGLGDKDEYGWQLADQANIRLEASFDWDTPQMWYDSIVITLPPTELSHLLQITIEPAGTKDFDVSLLLDTLEFNGAAIGPLALTPTIETKYDIAPLTVGMFDAVSITLSGGWQVDGPAESKGGFFAVSMNPTLEKFPLYGEMDTTEYPNVQMIGHARA